MSYLALSVGLHCSTTREGTPMGGVWVCGGSGFMGAERWVATGVEEWRSDGGEGLVGMRGRSDGVTGSGVMEMRVRR